MEEGQWRSCRTSPSFHHCTVAPPTPSARGQAADEVADMMIGDITLLTTGDGIMRISYLCTLKIW